MKSQFISLRARKLLAGLTALATVFSTFGIAGAAVTVTVAPVSLVTSAVTLPATSPQKALFSFSLSATATETLTSILVQVNKANASTTVSGSDLASVSLYKDDGSNVFNPIAGNLVGTQAVVNVGSSTTVTPATTTPATGKFYVSLATSGTWSGSVPADAITVTLPSNGITTSENSPTITSITTAVISADTMSPQLTSAMAKNTGGTSAKEAGDSVALTFSESTNKPSITNANIGSYFTLNNGHSFLDQGGNLGAASWNVEGTVLTITLSGTTTPTSTVPSVTVGDVVTVVQSANFVDITGNQVTGTQSISGSFAGNSGENEEEEVKGNCANGLINGRLYKIGTDATVYLAAACRLKPFRGQAVFKARGKKFQNIITLSSLPSNVSISDKPVLPTAGTLIKGSDRTVWFVDSHGKRRGFVSGEHFLKLGFKFGNVQTISDTDLNLVPVTSPIQTNENHPDGSVIKCSNQATVYQVIAGKKFPFASNTALENKDVNTTQILVVNCQNFKYTEGAPIN